MDAFPTRFPAAVSLRWFPRDRSLASLLEMRTLIAGLAALRRTPLAVVPMAIEGVVAAAFILARVFPASGVSAPAVAVFPLDIYFDLKQSLAHASAWAWFLGALVVSVLIRSLTLTTTLWLATDARIEPVTMWKRAGLLAVLAVPCLLPAALFLFVGVAVRYAPFVWVGAILGVVPALLLLKRVTAREAAAAGHPRTRVPTVSGYFSYAYALAAVAAGMTFLARIGVWAPAALLVLSAPVHASFLLGWRDQARTNTVPGGPPWATLATVAVIVLIFGSAVLDRFVRDGGAAAPSVAGSLVLLGGINSTSTTGALSDLDPRRLGFSPSRTSMLSYRRGGTYGENATHGNLMAIARVVAEQLHATPRPIDLVGHSQAALILDRILKMHLAAPDKAVLLAAPPPYPPSLNVPHAGRNGPGKVAADMARPLSRVFELLGADGFNLDAPAAPFRLARVDVPNAAISRVAVWALGDSVWLQGDWRRPGETNLVAVTDHVGVTNDPRALSAAARFFGGRTVSDEGSSWRGLAVNIVRYAFEPWRPG
ncbi:MAG: hypothetical protein QOG21_646 [Actinomycetota bacterium]|nr:hypothetical protein [Actinomycetota bacterium]